jgi:hypothetical protein
LRIIDSIFELIGLRASAGYGISMGYEEGIGGWWFG